MISVKRFSRVFGAGMVLAVIVGSLAADEPVRIKAHDSGSVECGRLSSSLKKSSVTRLRLLAHSKIAT
jgi:hypothetical protein